MYNSVFSLDFVLFYHSTESRRLRLQFLHLGFINVSKIAI